MHGCYVYLKSDLCPSGLRSFPQYRDHQMLILERNSSKLEVWKWLLKRRKEMKWRMIPMPSLVKWSKVIDTCNICLYVIWKGIVSLTEKWDKSKGTLFRPFLVGTFETMCSLVIWKKNLFFLSNPYRCWKESWSYWDSVFLGFEIRYSPFGTTIRDLDICLNMFKCLINKYIYIYIYIYFFICYLLLFITC